MVRPHPVDVVMGVSGVGKTTLAKAWATAIGATFLEGDDLHPQRNREKLQRGEPLDDDDRWPWLDALGRAAAAGREHGRVVVSCSALRRRYRERLRLHLPSVTFVFLDAPRDLVSGRVATRAGHFAAPSLLASQFETLDPPGADEPDILRLDATATPSELLDALQAALVGNAMDGAAGRRL